MTVNSIKKFTFHLDGQVRMLKVLNLRVVFKFIDIRLKYKENPDWKKRLKISFMMVMNLLSYITNSRLKPEIQVVNGFISIYDVLSLAGGHSSGSRVSGYNYKKPFDNGKCSASFIGQGYKC